MLQITQTPKTLAIATDDMSYYKINSNYYKQMNLYKQEKTNKKITELLKTNNFSKQEIKTITKNDFLTTNCRKKPNDFCCKKGDCVVK